MLLSVTVQSCVRGPVIFTVANATKTLENKAEKLTSTSTPQTNIRRFFRGSSERGYEKGFKTKNNMLQKCFTLTVLLYYYGIKSLRAADFATPLINHMRLSASLLI